jgi:hypothetical protein
MTLKDHVLIFRTPEAARGIYDTLFGGFFNHDYLIRGQKLAAVGFFAIAAASLFAPPGKKLWSVAGRVSSLLGFVTLVALLNHPVDEIFINLRHSQHLATDGIFSFNAHTPIEGIVDFLPYFVLGLLAKLGLPLPELAFLQSLAGGLLVIAAWDRIALHLGAKDAARNGMFLLACLYPPLVFNSATGFSSAVFAATILWTIQGLFFSGSPAGGLIGLAFIPLVRLEGGLASLLLYIAYWFAHRPPTRKVLATGSLILLPTALLSLYRWRTFGSIIPNPITYKQSLGDYHFLFIGMKSLFSELWESYGIAAIGLFATAWVASTNRRQLNRLAVVFAALFIFSMPYYLSGGDWFPPEWGRYLLPFSVFAVFSAVLALYLSWQNNTRVRRIWIAVTIVAFAVPYTMDSSSLPKLKGSVTDWWAGRGNFRIQALSRVGLHLGRTSNPDDVIASSEVATVMFFAKREALDLLGVANPEIAKLPLNSHFLFRRHDPRLVNRRKPAFLYPGDFILTDLTPQSSRAQIDKELDRLTDTFGTMNRFFFGGPPNLLHLGYQPILVIYGNHFSTMYYVSAAALPHHLRALDEIGFQRDQSPLTPIL